MTKHEKCMILLTLLRHSTVGTRYLRYWYCTQVCMNKYCTTSVGFATNYPGLSSRQTSTIFYRPLLRAIRTGTVVSGTQTCIRMFDVRTQLSTSNGEQFIRLQ